MSIVSKVVASSNLKSGKESRRHRRRLSAEKDRAGPDAGTAPSDLTTERICQAHLPASSG